MVLCDRVAAALRSLGDLAASGSGHSWLRAGSAIEAHQLHTWAVVYLESRIHNDGESQRRRLSAVMVTTGGTGRTLRAASAFYMLVLHVHTMCCMKCIFALHAAGLWARVGCTEQRRVGKQAQLLQHSLPANTPL